MDSAAMTLQGSGDSGGRGRLWMLRRHQGNHVGIENILHGFARRNKSVS